jgi:hypothetical protein
LQAAQQRFAAADDNDTANQTRSSAQLTSWSMELIEKRRRAQAGETRKREPIGLVVDCLEARLLY